MKMIPKRRIPTRLVFALITVTSLFLMTGCFENGPVDHVTVRPDGQLGIAVDGEGWRVIVAGEKDVHVTEEIVVEIAQKTVVITWSNEDDRFHEIMFHRDHADHDAIRLNSGQMVEQSVPVGFDRYVHSHHAPEMSEIRLRVVN